MLRRGLVLDLSTAFGFGTTFGYLWWYGKWNFTSPSPANRPLTSLPGYHLPRVRERDAFYTRLEQERAAQRG
ncbi:Cytochrome c oxidase subunit 7A [Penicillium sp. IBT 18751x]|nr:Cytochrome c oxidase subunit 7A [Penicillium sp. IBT 18751x]